MNIRVKYLVIVITFFFCSSLVAMDQLSSDSFVSCDSHSNDSGITFFGKEVPEDHPLLELDCVAKGIFPEGIPKKGFDFETQFFPLESAQQEGLNLSDDQAQDFLNHLELVQKQEPISFLRNDFEYKAKLFFFAHYLCMKKHPLFLRYLEEMLNVRSYMSCRSLSFKKGNGTIYIQNYIKNHLQKSLVDLVSQYIPQHSVDQVEDIPEKYIQSSAKKNIFLISNYTHYTDRFCQRRYKQIKKKFLQDCVKK